MEFLDPEGGAGHQDYEVGCLEAKGYLMFYAKLILEIRVAMGVI